jgi:hypothetical protein
MSKTFTRTLAYVRESTQERAKHGISLQAYIGNVLPFARSMCIRMTFSCSDAVITLTCETLRVGPETGT